MFLMVSRSVKGDADRDRAEKRTYTRIHYFVIGADMEVTE